MREFPVYGAFVVLSIGISIWGIKPALEKPNTDFSNYYVGARLVLEGHDLANLYDRDWFEERIQEYGIEDQQGTFVPFPPSTALVLIPIANLGARQAKTVWTIVNIIFLLACVTVLTRITRRPWVHSGALLLLSGIAVVNGFRFGQLYFLLLLLILAGIWVAESGREVTGGILLGLLLPIKYFPVVFLLYYAWLRRWRIVQSMIVTSGLVFLVGILVLGWEIHETFFTEVMFNHLDGKIQDPFTATFQSWNSLFRRLFVVDPVNNPTPVIDWSWGFPLLKNGVLIAIATVAVGVIRNIDRNNQRQTRLGLGLAAIAGLMVAPATATYHFVLLALPAALFISEHLGQRNIRWTMTFLLCYGLIGFLPMARVVRFFDHADARVFLAYPRLWLLTALYVLSVIFVHRSVLAIREQSRPDEPSE